MAGSSGGGPGPPGGYRFLRLVLIVGAIGFAVIGAVYLINGQVVPGIFALALAALEAAALPLFRKLLEMSRPPGASAQHDTGAPPPSGARAQPSRDGEPPR
jgi:hypothetical protein